MEQEPRSAALTRDGVWSTVRRWWEPLRASVMARLTVDGEEETAGPAPARPHAHRRRQSAPQPWPEENADPERALAPSSFEQRFTRLQRERDYPGMWDLIAPDAQEVWGGRDRFVEAMWREGTSGWSVLDVRVLGVQVLGEWHDARRDRDYHGVAQLRCRYRLRQAAAVEGVDAREVQVDRQVHLIPDEAGWRTLYYPPD